MKKPHFVSKMRFQTVEKPQFCVRQNWVFEHIVAKI